MVAPLLKFGFTPSQYRQWLCDGWTVAKFTPFVRASASPAQALPWLLAGKTSGPCAPLAAAGEVPDGPSRWGAFGLTAAVILQWRRNTQLEPEQAVRWLRVGVSMGRFVELQRLLAVEQSRALSRLTDATMEMVFRWIEQGVPPVKVFDWWIVVNGDLPTVLALCEVGVTLAVLQDLHEGLGRLRSDFAPIDDANDAHIRQRFPSRHPWVAPDTATLVAWVNAGANPASSADLKACLRSQLTPQRFVVVDGRGVDAEEEWGVRLSAARQQIQRVEWRK